ncbi:MAG: hypothetical protein JKY48_00430 [Flavobacteriales bacterium]|nr:hypothetical protein [Flavobacteriales bacterium]
MRNDLDGKYANDLFGTSVAINASNNTIAISSEYNSDKGENTEHVKVYQSIDSTWFQLGENLDGEENLDQNISSQRKISPSQIETRRSQNKRDFQPSL